MSQSIINPLANLPRKDRLAMEKRLQRKEGNESVFALQKISRDGKRTQTSARYRATGSGLYMRASGRQQNSSLKGSSTPRRSDRENTVDHATSEESYFSMSSHQDVSSTTETNMPMKVRAAALASPRPILPADHAAAAASLAGGHSNRAMAQVAAQASKVYYNTYGRDQYLQPSSSQASLVPPPPSNTVTDLIQAWDSNQHRRSSRVDSWGSGGGGLGRTSYAYQPSQDPPQMANGRPRRRSTSRQRSRSSSKEKEQNTRQASNRKVSSMATERSSRATATPGPEKKPDETLPDTRRMPTPPAGTVPFPLDDVPLHDPMGSIPLTREELEALAEAASRLNFQEGALSVSVPPPPPPPKITSPMQAAPNGSSRGSPGQGGHHDQPSGVSESPSMTLALPKETRDVSLREGEKADVAIRRWKMFRSGRDYRGFRGRKDRVEETTTELVPFGGDDYNELQGPNGFRPRNKLFHRIDFAHASKQKFISGGLNLTALARFGDTALNLLGSKIAIPQAALALYGKEEYGRLARLEGEYIKSAAIAEEVGEFTPIVSMAWRLCIDVYAAATHAKHVSIPASIFYSWKRFASTRAKRRRQAAKFFMDHASTTLTPALGRWVALYRACAFHKISLLSKTFMAMREYKRESALLRNAALMAKEYHNLRCVYNAIYRMKKRAALNKVVEEAQAKAKAYWRRRALRTAVADWAEGIQWSIAHNELSVLAIDHYRRRLASSILRAWRKEAVDSIKIRMCQHQSDQSLLQQTFTGWVTVVQDRARRRLQLQDAALYHHLKTMLHYFSNWRDSVIKAVARRRALYHYVRRRLTLGLSTWLEFTANREASRNVVVRASEHYAVSLVSRYLRNWHKESHLQQQTQRIETLRRQNLITSSFRTWKSYAARQHHSRALAIRAAAFSHQRVQKQVLRLWKARYMSAQRSRAFARSFFYKLKDMWQSQRDRAYQRYFVSSTKPLFRHWKRFLEHRRYIRSLNEKSQDFYEGTLLAKAFEGLRLNVDDAREASQAADAFAANKNISFIRRLLRFWHFWTFRWENLAYRVRIRETKRNFFAWRQLIDAKNHAKQVMTAKYLLASFRRWEDYIEYRKARKQMMATVTSWHLKRLAGRVFHGWQAVVHRGGWRVESQVRIADAFRHLQLLSRAFGPWAALALRARDRYARIRNRLQLPESVSLQNDEDVIRKFRLKKMFRQWAGHTRAGLFFVLRLYGKFFHKWRSVTLSLALEREQSLIARSHYRWSLVSKTFHALNYWAHNKEDIEEIRREKLFATASSRAAAWSTPSRVATTRSTSRSRPSARQQHSGVATKSPNLRTEERARQRKQRIQSGDKPASASTPTQPSSSELPLEVSMTSPHDGVDPTPRAAIPTPTAHPATTRPQTSSSTSLVRDLYATEETVEVRESFAQERQHAMVSTPSRIPMLKRRVSNK